MCLLALFFRVVEDAPLVAGANREEVYARGGSPPAVLDGPVRAVAGLDPTAGGTWFGVNARGVLVAVTNRPKSEVPARPRSRGLLARELLAHPTASAAADAATRALDKGPYAGCNVVCADRDTLVVMQAGDWLRVKPLPPGIHVLTNDDVNDLSDRRVGHSLWWLNERRYAGADTCVAALKELCAQDGSGGGPAICYRGDKKGTVSSSVVALPASPRRWLYLHAQGPPDRTPYADCSALLRQIASPSVP